MGNYLRENADTRNATAGSHTNNKKDKFIVLDCFDSYVIIQTMEVGVIIFVGIIVVLFASLQSRANQRNRKWQWEENLNHNRELIESVTQLNRGTWSERDLVLELLKNDFKPGAIFHDLYLKKSNGQHTQIDLVLATSVGLIVFEVKDYSGWIFGKGNQSNWTQVLAYGRDKYRFYNPVRQNSRHISELKKQSKQFAQLPMFSVIVFYGNCELRNISFIPAGTYITTSRRVLDVIETIINNNAPANYTDKHEIIRILKQAVYNGATPEMQEQHAETIQDMIGKDRVFD